MGITRTLGVAAVSGALCLALAAPAAALGDEPQSDHGPMPVAIFGTIFGATFFALSVPFTALVAPLHVLESFDSLVMQPWRVTTGERPPHQGSDWD